MWSRRMMGRATTLTMLMTMAAMVALGACAARAPANSEIRRLVATEANAAGDDPLFDMRDFERLDGREAGEGRYVAEVSYTLVYRKSSDDVKAEIQAGMKDAGPDNIGEALGSMLGVMALSFQSFEKGDTKNVTQTVTLEHWESGWKLAAGK